MPTSPTQIDIVLDDEVKLMRNRRREAGYENYEKDSDELPTKEEVRESLTGLALSGGGVRSGAFCLGMIQALYTSGRLRAIDFVSTVSGGGYAGALLSSEIARSKGKIDWKRRGEHSTDRLKIETEANGSQPERIRELALYGRMFGDFLKLLSRHLSGFILTLAFVVSGMLTLASVLAYLMRMAYSHEALPYLAKLKFSNDVTLPFFPLFLATVFWIFAQVFSGVMRSRGKQSVVILKLSYLLLVATGVLGILTFFAISDVDLSTWIRQFGVSPDFAERLTYMVNWLSPLIAGLAATTLLPLFHPRKLMESGANQHRKINKFVFNITGYAVVVMVPLTIFFMMAHENISGHKTHRLNPDCAQQPHLRLPEELVKTLRIDQSLEDLQKYQSQDAERLLLAFDGEEEVRDLPKSAVNFSVSFPRLPTSVTIATDEDVAADRWTKNQTPNVEKLLNYVAIRNEDEKVSFAQSWLDALMFWNNDRFIKRVENQQAIHRVSDKIAKGFSRNALSDPFLFPFEEIENAEPTPKPDADSPTSIFGGNKSNKPPSIALTKREKLEARLKDLKLIAREEPAEQAAKRKRKSVIKAAEFLLASRTGVDRMVKSCLDKDNPPEAQKKFG